MQTKVIGKARVNSSEMTVSIQGLYSIENSCQSFWSLKAKIELSAFREHKKEVKKT
jgi:hypothetical protein